MAAQRNSWFAAYKQLASIDSGKTLGRGRLTADGFGAEAKKLVLVPSVRFELTLHGF